jgi:hypothetical protein
MNMTKSHTRSSAARTWRCSTIGAVVIGTLAAMFIGSAASAVDACDNTTPLENPQCFDDDPAGGGSGGGSGGSSTTDDCYDDNLGTDGLKILDSGIDFGDDNWFAGAPLGWASVEWSVDCGFYSADVVGTLRLEDGRRGRVHVDFINADGVEETKHSRTRTAPANGHESWSVNLSPSGGEHIVEVQVCTEISNDGVHFDAVTCKTKQLG